MLSITVTPAGQPESLAGIPVRPWRGTDQDGLEYLLFVHRICSADPMAHVKLSGTLTSVEAPPAVPFAEFVALVSKMRACQRQATQTREQADLMRGYQAAVDDAIARIVGSN